MPNYIIAHNILIFIAKHMLVFILLKIQALLNFSKTL
jgi:hypothetical protein